MSNYVKITDKNGTRKVYMDKIDEIMDFVEGHVMKDKKLDLGKSNFEASEMLRSANLSDEQMRWLADRLLSKVFYYARMWRASLTREHHASLGKMLTVRDMAQKVNLPVDLWPELDE